MPNAQSEYYRSKAVEYERLAVENAGLPISEEFRRAKQTLIALAEKEEWLSRGTLGRDPQWTSASVTAQRGRAGTCQSLAAPRKGRPNQPRG
jgi:hypothetical protein